jgi:hypothetical protein
MARLKDSFEFVRKEFFPKWDNKREWIVGRLGLKDSRHFKAHGICNRKSKSIYLRWIPGDQNNLYWILIHEICHAVSPGFHGKRWNDQMLKASELARKKGNTLLSRMILRDLAEKKLVLMMCKRSLENYKKVKQSLEKSKEFLDRNNPKYEEILGFMNGLCEIIEKLEEIK